ASLVGAQYFWVLYHHPVALMGEQMVREGYVPGVEMVEVMMARSGHPRAAFRNSERHCRLDVRHRAELIEVLDSLPLGEEHPTIMGVSALHAVQMGIQANRELLELADGLPSGRLREAAVK